MPKMPVIRVIGRKITVTTERMNRLRLVSSLEPRRDLGLEAGLALLDRLQLVDQGLHPIERVEQLEAVVLVEPGRQPRAQPVDGAWAQRHLPPQLGGTPPRLAEPLPRGSAVCPASTSSSVRSVSRASSTARSLDGVRGVGKQPDHQLGRGLHREAVADRAAELGGAVDRAPPRAHQPALVDVEMQRRQAPRVRVGAGHRIADHAEDGIAERLQARARAGLEQRFADGLRQVVAARRAIAWPARPRS